MAEGMEIDIMEVVITQDTGGLIIPPIRSGPGVRGALW